MSADLALVLFQDKRPELNNKNSSHVRDPVRVSMSVLIYFVPLGVIVSYTYAYIRL